MPKQRLLLLFALMMLPSCSVLAEQPLVMSGCLSQDASGTLHFQDEQSRRVYRLQGDMEGLQRGMNRLITLSGNLVANAASAPMLSVVQYRVISNTCTSVLPSNEQFEVSGKAGPVAVAIPVTSSGRANETTAGFQTEAGQEQAAAKVIPSTNRSAKTPFAPSQPEQAGQSEFAADLDAEAASRAEVYPGTTLGVDIKTAPPSSVQALEESGKAGKQAPR